jgi:hypothetical protein
MQIAGYYMRRVEGATELQRYAEKPFLDSLGTDYANILNETILPVFRDLHHTVSRLHEHEARILIGDLTDTNVLVKGSIAYLCDVDSFGFGDYPARLGKREFTDPLLAQKGPSPDTDWYAYTVLLLQSLLRVKPYAGIYIPKKTMPIAERIRQRLSIFHKDVQPPSWAIAPDMLPDVLLYHFEDVFGEADKRGPFPAYLLDMNWGRCRGCGAVHAREKCPRCHTFRRRTAIRRGQVRATPIFTRDNCSIITSAYQKGQLRYIYMDSDVCKREDGSTVTIALPGYPARRLRASARSNIENFKIQGENTVIFFKPASHGRKKCSLLCDPQGKTRAFSSEFHTNSTSLYCLEAGRVFRVESPSRNFIAVGADGP